MNTHLDFNDVLIHPKISKKTLTRKDINIEVDSGYPIAIANMMSTGTYNIAKILNTKKVYTFIHKEYTLEEHFDALPLIKNRQFIAITSGVQPWDKEKTYKILEKFPDIGIINVDIANVYANISGMIETIKFYKNAFLNCKVSAGNIASIDPIQPLIDAGADYIKIGVGSGSACKTRSEVGVGVPQLSALLKCAPEIHKLNCKVISDGGCVTSGDVVKAIGAGADIVMLAGMVSHCKECDNIIEIDGKQYVNVWGLGSKKQYDLTNPTEKEYRPNEGRNLLIPATKSIIEVIDQIKGGLRSACTYVGIDNIIDMKNNVEFIKVNNIINNSLLKYETTFN